MKFKYLMLEITRKCGMKCPHCMRGEPEEYDMEYDVIDAICKRVSSIEQLTITGGEPSMAVEQLEYLVKYLRYYRTEIDCFFCATNAQHYSERFADALCKLQQLCKKQDKCILTISIDQYHSTADPKALEEYRKLPFYKPVNEKGYIPPHEVLNEGRAEENGIGTFEIPFLSEIYDADFDGIDFSVKDRVYINVYGDVLVNPDASYKAQDECALGNILNEPLLDIVMANSYRIPDNWFKKDEHSVYRVKLVADAGIIDSEKTESNVYYAYARKASAAFHSIYHNLFMTPINPALGPPPKGLKLSSVLLPDSEARCIGREIRYHYPDCVEPKLVTIEVIRCPIEEEFNNVRE